MRYVQAVSLKRSLSVENTNVVGGINSFLSRISLAVVAYMVMAQENCIAAVVLQFRATTLQCQ